MPSFNAEVPHKLGQEAAVERLKSFIERVQDKFKEQVSEMSGEWVEHTLSFALKTFGFKISGKLVVEDEVARLDGTLPFAAVAFRGKIQQQIAQELERVLR